MTNMIYREPLPDDCPPDEAEEINAPRFVYRLVSNVPPSSDDFKSQRLEKPRARFNVSECRARGVSVFANIRDAERQTRRQNLKHLAPCRVTLTAGAGRIQQTGGHSHHTWWPYESYDILAHCQLVHS